MQRLLVPIVGLAGALAGCGSVSPAPPASQPAALSDGHHEAEQPAGHPHDAQQAAQPASQPHGKPHGHAHPPGQGHGAHAHHRFTDAERWSKRFDAPERDAWQKPDAVIARLALTPQMRVADVGAGTGYFAVRFAQALPKGRVIGADIEAAMVDFMSVRAAEAGLTNMIAVEVSPTAPRLPEPVDLMFVCNTWHHVQQRGAWLASAAAQINPGGRLAIVDYKPGVDSPGPPQSMRLTAEQVIAEAQAAGYTLAERDDALLPRQYLLVFKAPSGGTPQ